MALTKAQRKALFEMFGGKCAYCGCDLPKKGWHADHIEPVLRDFEWVRVHGDPRRTHKAVQTGVLRNPENDRHDNYFPSCRACNIDKNCMPLESWREWLEHKPTVLRNNHSAWRHAERFGLVAVVKTKVVFYFETLKEPFHAGSVGDEHSQCSEVHSPDGTEGSGGVSDLSNSSPSGDAGSSAINCNSAEGT